MELAFWRTGRLYGMGAVVLGLLAAAWGATDQSPGPRGTCRVEKVLDGDTIVCEGGLTVRYAGIDTPEVFQTFAERARQTNRAWVLGRTVEYAATAGSSPSSTGRTGDRRRWASAYSPRAWPGCTTTRPSAGTGTAC